MGTIIKDGVQYSGFGGQGATIDDTVERVDTTWSSRKIAEEVGSCAKATSVYTKTQTYTKAEVDALIESAGGVEIDDDAMVLNKTWSSNKIDTVVNSALGDVNINIASSLMMFTDAHGLFRYTTNYGSDTELEAGEIYDVTGDILISINGVLAYQGALKEVPYNNLSSGASQQNIGGTAGYKWKEWVVNYSSIIEDYSEIPIKVAFIGQVAANNKYNPYIHIIYPSYIYQQGFEITFECRATNYTKVTPEPSGGGGLQEYAYTISSPSSTTISNAMMAALADAITNVGIDNLEKLRKVIARTEWTYFITPHVKECIYDVKYLNISKGGGNFDDIDICAEGSANYYSTGNEIKTTKFIASRYQGILDLIEMSGTNPIMIETDQSANNVESNASPWYHNSSGVSDVSYKLVFVYG